MSILEKNKILPVIVLNDVSEALPVAEALLAGGIQAIEVTFRTEAAAGSIKAIREKLPEMTVAAGTVVTLEQAKRAIDAGSQFCLAPGTDPEVVAYSHSLDIPFIPGVMTPSDVQLANKLGCSHLKFFPAEAAGGVPLLKSLIAPYKSLGLKFCPTGGVKPGNLSSYLSIPEIFAVGGTWLATPQLINDGAWSTITENSKTALEAAG